MRGEETQKDSILRSERERERDVAKLLLDTFFSCHILCAIGGWEVGRGWGGGGCPLCQFTRTYAKTGEAFMVRPVYVCSNIPPFMSALITYLPSCLL